MAGLGYAAYLVSASGQGARLIGSKLVVVRSTYEELSTIAPNPLLCSLGLALLTISWDKNWDSHSLVNGYPSFYPRIALVAPSPDGVLYRGILQNTLVPFARHYFGDNYRYQDDNATPHRAGVVLNFLQQGNVTKMEQPPRSPDCNPIEHLWDELGRAISSMDNPAQNLDELRQALSDKWAQIPVQRLQRLVASMPRRLAAIIAARGGNTRYWPGTHKTRPPGSVTKKIRPNLPQLSSSDI